MRRVAAPSAVFLAGTTAVVAAYTVALGLTGVDAATLARWLLSMLLGWLLPGFVVVRVVRPPSMALLDEVAWATPAGLLVVLLGWASGRATGLPLPAWLFGVVLIGVLVAVPASRNRLLRPPAPGWGRLAGAVVVVSLVIAVASAAASGLSASPVAPGAAGFPYSPDTMFQTAMAGELAHATRPTYPMVAGEPLAYHWFCYAIAAQLGQGINTMTVMVRLLPLALLLSTILMVAAVARQVCGGRLGPAAGAIGAVLAGLLGNTMTTAWVWPNAVVRWFRGDGGALDPLRQYWQDSPTATLGWVMGLAAAGVLVGALRSSERWWFAGVFVAGVMSAGAKASVPPVLICGALLVAGVALLQRNRGLTLRALVATAVLVASYLTAMQVIYGGSGYGTRVYPGYRAATLATQFGGPVQSGLSFWLAAVPLTMAIYLLPSLTRLLGLCWLLGRRPRDPAGWLLTGAVIAGFAAMQLVGHPAHAEVYFFVSAYPLGLAGSAAGLAVLADVVVKHVPARAVVVSLGLGMGIALVGSAVIVARAGVGGPTSGHLLAWAAPLLAMVLVQAVALAATTPWWRRHGSLFGLTAMAGLLVVGLIPTWLSMASFGTAAARQQARIDLAQQQGVAQITPELIEASAVIRQQARSTDIIASNRVCYLEKQRMTRPGCDPRDFTVAALTGRRTDVTGWAYADRVVSTWTRYSKSQFWDPPRLAAEQLLISNPDLDVVTQKWDEGVRWILADRSAGRVSSRLGTYGTVEYDNGGVVVVRLLDPHR